MSEVKPTLIKEVLKDPEVPNAWITNFTNWLWDDARGREYTWIITYFTVINAKGYEYKVSFETPVEKFGLTFPFVVKTQSSGVKKVSIYGVEYYPRSKSNYGTSFVVSGSNFHFKSATRYKLEGEVFNIVRLFYSSPQFRNRNEVIITIPLMLKNLYLYNLNDLDAELILTRFAQFLATEKSNAEIRLNTIRNLEPVFLNTNEFHAELSFSDITFKQIARVFCDVVLVKGVSATFLNKHVFEPSFEVQKTISPEFLNKAQIDLRIDSITTLTSSFLNKSNFEVGIVAFRDIRLSFANLNKLDATTQKADALTCSETNWNRFGGVWTGCGTWTL